jgi:hypothetical protein
VQPGAVGEGGVHERAGQVHAAAAGPQHDLDQVVDLLLAEDGGGELGRPLVATNTLPASLIQIPRRELVD